LVFDLSAGLKSPRIPGPTAPVGLFESCFNIVPLYLYKQSWYTQNMTPQAGKKFSARHNLGFQLLALYLLFVIPVLAGALAFNSFARKRLEQDVKAADLALARAIALETDAALNNALQTVAQLS